MADWPDTLPGFLSGIGDKRGSAKSRSSVDVGPAIVRRRYTSAVRNINVPMRMTNAQRVIFEAFYADDLKEGTLSFNWIDPLTMATVALRFRGIDGPDWQGQGAYNADPALDTRAWSATFELEILP